MKFGTKSVLYGAHCFLIHPWFVALASWKLFGFPWDPRLWVAFFVHDLGYWGSPNMDGPEGERHPEWAARLMFKWFDGDHQMVGSELSHETRQGGVAPRYGGARVLPHPTVRQLRLARFLNRAFGRMGGTFWHDLVLYHSRFYAKADRRTPSRLCIADKLAVALEPWWFYLPRVNATSEIHEYMELAKARIERGEGKYAGERKYASMALATSTQREWFEAMTAYLRRWVEEHRDGREDTWTPGGREPRDDTGVYS